MIHNDEIFSDGKLNNNKCEIQTCEKNIEIILMKQCKNKICVLLCHKRLGHRNTDSIKGFRNLSSVYKNTHANVKKSVKLA